MWTDRGAVIKRDISISNIICSNADNLQNTMIYVRPTLRQGGKEGGITELAMVGFILFHGNDDDEKDK